MITTLSEKRNEKLLCEWSGEITDGHAKDFCEVCNAVFGGIFTTDYIRRKYEANIYGRSFILVVYKDNKPVAAWGAWRNDFFGRTAFQMCDFAVMPFARKGGYVLDMLYCLYDELGRSYPGSVIYGFPGPMAYPVMIAAGWAPADFYARIFHGPSEDFIRSMPFIPDEYVESFFLSKKDTAVLKVRGKYYLLLRRRIKRLIPAGTILGEISSKFADSFRHTGRFRMYLYRSLKPGIFGTKSRVSHAVKYDTGTSRQVMDTVPPVYTADGYSLDFNIRTNN